MNKSISPYTSYVLLNYAHIMCGISLQTNITTSGKNSLQKYLFSSFKQLVTIDYHAMHIWPFLLFLLFMTYLYAILWEYDCKQYTGVIKCSSQCL